MPDQTTAAATFRDLRPVFNALPGAYLLLTPELLIEAASDDYLAATLTTREQLVGRLLFDAFPDNPATPDAHSTRNLRASLAQVLATGQRHQMASQHYDVPDPTRPGAFAERHWLPTNRPVLDAEGHVTHVIHAVVDVTAERQAAQVLRASQAAEQAARAEAEAQRQRLHEVLMQLPAHVAVHHGPDQVFTFVNPAYQVMAAGRVLLGQSLREVWPELAGQGILNRLDQVYQTGEPFVGTELPLRVDFARTGHLQQVYYNAFFLPLRDAQGHVTGVLNFLYDVSEQVRARQQVQQLNHELEARVAARTQDLEQARAEAEAERYYLHALVAEAPALIARLRGPDHFMELANERFCRLLGGRALVGQPYRAALPDLKNQPFFDQLDVVYRTGKTYYGKEVAAVLDRANSGELSTGYFNYTYQPTRDMAGQVDGILLFAEEVTEQVLARREREQQRQQLHDLFMQAPAAICILAGPDLVYELVNPGYQMLFPGRPLLGRPLLDALPEIAGHAVHHGFRAVYETGATREEEALLIPLARPGDGVLEDRYFKYVQQARRDARGQPDGVLVFAFEVTELVRARQQAQALATELTTANEQLSRTNVDLDNFIYTASHDLKAPISNIEGLLYLLQEELPATVTQKAFVGATLTRMLDSVERFKRTIGHLTAVSKLQKEHTPVATAVNLAAVIDGVRQDLVPLLREAAAQLVVEVAALPPVQFSEKNLRSIIYNLLSNAVKYHAPARPPRVDVRGHVHLGYTVLEVQDNGLGIDPAHLPRLFGMFQRFHDHVEGSGIGLYMVKRMVENGGGRIEVHSQLGVGTTFRVYLPHASALAAA